MAASTSSGGGGAVNKVERAHQLYRDGRYDDALTFYTEALSVAKTKPQKIALHSNRAACFLKLHHFKKAAEECTSVLELDHDHTGALMLRAQTLVTLNEYHSALFDVNRLIELNPSSEVYQNLQTRLKTQLSLAPIPEDHEAELEEEDEVLDDVKLEERHEGEIDRVVEKPVNELHEVKAEGGVGPRSKATTTQSINGGNKPNVQQSSGWKQIPKPKGHTQLDYSRWDRVEDDDSDDDDEDDSDDDESESRYRFRVRNIGVRAVK